MEAAIAAPVTVPDLVGDAEIDEAATEQDHDAEDTARGFEGDLGLPDLAGGHSKYIYSTQRGFRALPQK